jgi:CubicO group peptidase (beta-lactamase class C family)
MFKAIINAIYSFVVAVTNSLGLRTPPAPGWEWKLKSELDAPNQDIVDLFKRYMQADAIKAGQFAVQVDGHLAMSVAFTWAEPGYPITETDSVMRIASCSKTFTTAAIKALMPYRLQSDQKIFELLEITKKQPGPDGIRDPLDRGVLDITVADLISHSGGWNYDDRNPPAPDPIFSLKAIGLLLRLDHPPGKLEFAEYIYDHVNLDFTPGTDVKYSNIGYTLLGMVVEKVSGKPYLDFLQDELLNDIGIRDVFVGKTSLSGRLDNEVLYEDPFRGPDATQKPDSPLLAPLPYGGSGTMTELMDSSGGLVTSARSLSRFIFHHKVVLKDIDHESDERYNGTIPENRVGGMPGTSAVACSFKNKNGTKKYDYAFIFNQKDKGSKNEILHDPSSKLDHLCKSLEELIERNF